MSIRQQNQINDLLRRVEALEEKLKELQPEEKRKPGRPKNGQQDSVSA